MPQPGSVPGHSSLDPKTNVTINAFEIWKSYYGRNPSMTFTILYCSFLEANIWRTGMSQPLHVGSYGKVSNMPNVSHGRDHNKWIQMLFFMQWLAVTLKEYRKHHWKKGFRLKVSESCGLHLDWKRCLKHQAIRLLHKEFSRRLISGDWVIHATFRVDNAFVASKMWSTHNSFLT